MKLLPNTGVDVGITAREPARLVHFYGDFLGMELDREADWPDVGSHIWFFRCGDSHIKVCTRTSPPAGANPPGGHTVASGLRYLAFRVESIDEALIGLEDAGGTIQVPPEVHGEVRVVFLYDPEGNSIELIEAHPRR